MRSICVGGFIGLIWILSATRAKADGTRLDGSDYMSDADNENFKVPASEVAFDDGSSGSRFGEFLNAWHGDGLVDRANRDISTPGNEIGPCARVC
jgi:hypothetical protein